MMRWPCLLLFPSIVSVVGRSDSSSLTVPWSTSTFEANEDCSWTVSRGVASSLKMNEHYIAPPISGISWEAWIKELQGYRKWTRDHLNDSAAWIIDMNYRGVRAWVRIDRQWSFAADLLPGDRITLNGQARWVEGNSTLCLAFDWCDRGMSESGVWKGWSSVQAATSIARDGEWHDFSLTLEVPTFNRRSTWARPILGMDATYDKRTGHVQLRSLSLQVPRTEERAFCWEALEESLSKGTSFNDCLYDRSDLNWCQSNFACGFVFVYDKSFWNPETSTYEVERLCEQAVETFGGYDSIVLWHAYPRIGADERNQFDFFRHMPGGLPGVRDMVGRFHEHGVKVFLPYNPWDIGTRREEKSDEDVLAKILAATDADGIFLDTMLAAPSRLREVVDEQRLGVVFEPEGHPALQELEQCNASWAQGLKAYDRIGVLRLKWIEQRHMQHQIRRWDTSHRDELATAWLNGSGMLVWENVFGTWNPWNREDRETLRRMLPIQRQFASLLAEGEWLPHAPSASREILVGHWCDDRFRLWTLVRRGGKKSVSLNIFPRPGERFFDLWTGRPLNRVEGGEESRVSFEMEAFGAVAGVVGELAAKSLRPLLAQQAGWYEAGKRQEDLHMKSFSVVKPKAPPDVEKGGKTAGLLSMKGETRILEVSHMRRECGCYPDPGAPENEWDTFLTGIPHNGQIHHRVQATVGRGWIAPKVVSNGEYESFLKASGYFPKCEDRFLEHWEGKTCPVSIKEDPVVYVDLADARAYAAWAKMRLPTEWEWHAAAEDHGENFKRGRVWEWTESERDDGHTRFVMLRGGSRYQAQGSGWYFPGGKQPVETHAKFLLMYPGLDRCSTIGFRCVRPGS